jgi:hypothetical protein
MRIQAVPGRIRILIHELTWNNDGVCLLPVLAETAHTAEGLQEFLQIREKLLLDLENNLYQFF